MAGTALELFWHFASDTSRFSDITSNQLRKLIAETGGVVRTRAEWQTQHAGLSTVTAGADGVNPV